MLAENSLSHYLDKALASMPSAFARLVFLSSLRNHYTGRYIHEGWVSFSSPAEVHKLLRETHQSVFKHVLTLPIMTLSRELRKHYQSLGEDEFHAASFWLDIEPYHEMIPEACSRLSREFFISQLRAALEILALAPNWEYLEEPISLLRRQLGPRLPRPSSN